MKRILIATTSSLATLAGTASAFAQETCEDLINAYEASEFYVVGDVTLTNRSGTIECEYEEGVLVENDGGGPEQTLTDLLNDKNTPPQARFGLETALRAINGDVGGEDQAQLARTQGGERSEQGNQRAEQGSQRARNGGGRENAGGRP